jgi:hypothetical protein
MHSAEIESLPEVIQAVEVLKHLEEGGLNEVAIASGWTRGFLTNTTPTDIDIAYVGSVHFSEAQVLLKSILAKLAINPDAWDIAGIWNAQLAKPYITSIRDHFLRDYVCSIDSVYLASDGKLHDATGFGFHDAANKVLRINPLIVNPPYTPRELVYIYLESCRRITRFGWSPTEDGAQTIRQGTALWQQLSPDDRAYFLTRITKKYTPNEYDYSRSIYDQYGWGFVFDAVA